MGAGDAVREVEVVAVLPVVQPPVVERVEHQLAREAEEVERRGPVLGDERAGGREVLAQHDLVGLGGAVLVRRVLGARAARTRRSRSRSCSSGSPVWRSSLPLSSFSGWMRSRMSGSAWSRSHVGVSMMCASASWTIRPSMYGMTPL